MITVLYIAYGIEIITGAICLCYSTQILFTIHQLKSNGFKGLFFKLKDLNAISKIGQITWVLSLALLIETIRWIVTLNTEKIDDVTNLAWVVIEACPYMIISYFFSQIMRIINQTKD